MERRKIFFFSSVSTGVTGTGKSKAWREVTDAVNAVYSVERLIQEVRRKWFDMKLDAKNRIFIHRQNTTGGGTS